MSARNRELLIMSLAGIVASAAFASAWFAQATEIDYGWLPWAAVLAGVFLVGARRRAADGPGCRPDAPADHRAALRDRPDVRVPPRPGVRAEAARMGRGRRRGLRSRPLLAALRLPDPRALQVSVRGLGDRAADAAVGARARAANQRRQALGGHRPAAVPARRGREDLPRRLPRRVSPRQARGAGPAEPQGRRAARCDLGRRDARPRPDERPRLGAPQLRDLPRDAVRRDGPRLVRRRRPRPVRGRRRAAVRRPRPRPAARDGVARAVDGREGVLRHQRRDGVPPELRLLPAREEPLLDRERRVRRYRDRQRHVPDRRRDAFDPVPRDRLRLLGDRAGARADRRRRRAPLLPRARRPRHARRADRAGRLLEATRRRPQLRVRAADVHHRRRRPAHRPADRHHAAVRLVRRDERRRELRDARAPDARLPPRREARARDESAADTRGVDRDGADRRARRRHDVLADLGAPRARGATGQRDPAGRGVRGTARPDPRPHPDTGEEPRRAAARKDVLLPHLPAGEARRARGRLLDHLAEPGRAGEVAQRHPHRAPIVRSRTSSSSNSTS